MQITYASKTIQRLCKEDKHQHALSIKMQSKPCRSAYAPTTVKSGLNL
jgi:hypothetical protein